MAKSNNWYANVWNNVQNWAYKYIGGLFMDEKAGKLTVSLGRVSLVGLLVMFVWVWRRTVLDGEVGVALPEGMLEVFYIFAGYVFGSKITSSLKSKWDKEKS